jgi:hypothetical protein
MIGQRHQIARFQSDFYRDCYYKVLKWLFIEVAIMILLILAIIYNILLHAPQLYFASTTNGQLLALLPGK